MDEVVIARALHVVGVVVWIGGVGMVTTVILPVVLGMRGPGKRLALFGMIERRFAWHARAMTLLVGVTGFYMVYDQSMWDRFSQPESWWMHAMVATWAVFSVILFVAEPLFLHRWFRSRYAIKPESTIRLIHRAHVVLLILSLFTAFAAGAGSHGGW